MINEAAKLYNGKDVKEIQKKKEIKMKQFIIATYVIFTSAQFVLININHKDNNLCLGLQLKV